MDSTRSMLLALARQAEEARLRWYADRAAVRARGETPARTEAYAYHVQANLCLITALGAADLPANFRIYDITLSRDPLAAAEQLRQVVFGYDHSGAIEAEHEEARLAYKAAFRGRFVVHPPAKLDEVITRAHGAAFGDEHG